MPNDEDDIGVGGFAMKEHRARVVGCMLAVSSVTLAGCSGSTSGDGEGSSSSSGACEVSGGIIRATCYEGWTDCGRNPADTLHAGKTCEAAGYPRPCCREYGQASTAAAYWRPQGASCDSSHVVCGTSAPAQDKCKRCLASCRGDPLCCTGNGCYCESEC